MDGKKVRLASSVVDVFSATGTEALYFAAMTGGGIELVVYIPHFSVRTVTIAKLGFLARLVIPEVLIASTLAVTVLAAMVIALGRRGTPRALGFEYLNRMDVLSR